MRRTTTKTSTTITAITASSSSSSSSNTTLTCSFLVLLLIFILGLISCNTKYYHIEATTTAATAAATECSNFTTCETCVQHSECGWCAAIGECFKGDVAMPTSAADVVSWAHECRLTWYYSSCAVCDSVHEIYPVTDGDNFTIELPPQPNVAIAFNPDSRRITFDVEATYVRDFASYVLDFGPFELLGLSQIDAPTTNCSNRLASSFQGRNFSDFWYSAVDASKPFALGSTHYLAYPPTEGTPWSLTNTSCGSIKYHADWSFSELLHCKYNDNGGSGVVVRGGTPPIQYEVLNGTTLTEYRGTFYVSIVMPYDYEDRSAGYSRIMFAYPFRFQFNMFVSNVTNVSASPAGVRILVRDFYVDSGGRLQLELVTVMNASVNNGSSLVNPTALSSPSGVALEFVGLNPQQQESAPPCTYPCQQQWIVRSTAAFPSYEGVYRLRWDVLDCASPTEPLCYNNGRQATSRINIVSNVVVSEVSTSTSLSMITSTYSDMFSTYSAGPYMSDDTIFVKVALDLSPSDLDNFDIHLKNVWICYNSGPSSGPPVWNPAQGKYGCSVLSVGNVDNTLQLITNGSVTPGLGFGFDVQLFPPATPSIPALSYKSTAGFSFRAQPLANAARTSRVYYVHIEADFTPAQTGGGVGRRSGTSSKHVLSRSSSSSSNNNNNNNNDPTRGTINQIAAAVFIDASGGDKGSGGGGGAVDDNSDSTTQGTWFGLSSYYKVAFFTVLIVSAVWTLAILISISAVFAFRMVLSSSRNRLAVAAAAAAAATATRRERWYCELQETDSPQGDDLEVAKI